MEDSDKNGFNGTCAKNLQPCSTCNGRGRAATRSEEQDDPRILIPELCRLFYNLGWCTGTGGGISVKHKDLIYIAPSAVQKERIQPEDIFVQDINGKDIELPPTSKRLRKSQCTPLFMLAYVHRKAGAVIHSHSKHSVYATLVYKGKEFRIRHLEMIKGVKKDSTGKYYRYDEELVIPIVENTPEERDLEDRMNRAMMDYPDACAVLVRRHGFYVWGDTWQQAKAMCEALDYLFEISVELHRLGIAPVVDELSVPEEAYV
ncbi:methylthioribulose-1-phosphate dehydratase-like [Paramacrobiotus metropolitanus]|uniref:methylthioribulose-1-phosphate dehydratase-like n=1 Tax=Paramacrobiotus metropolitanus TaxID=2943436 RepID=UPI0024463AA0|nr:methylthioribulose-1-phosphate dehydratase-like [Paramacrobiotus metropolitanus]